MMVISHINLIVIIIYTKYIKLINYFFLQNYVINKNYSY